MVQNVTPVEVTSRGIADPHYVEVHPTTHHHHPHWGAIVAGVFIALSGLAILSTLGVAFGASVYGPGQDPRAWGIGSGVWAIISAILAFVTGGYVAARASGHTDRKTGLFHGLMVWAVVVPLLALLIGTGLSRLATGSAYVDFTPNGVYTADDARHASRNAAWGSLLCMVLGLGAASLGGQLGARGITTFRRIEPTTPVTG